MRKDTGTTSFGWKFALLGIALFGFVGGAEALTVEKIGYSPNGAYEATISYAAAERDRAVFVGFGDADKGSQFSAWGASVEGVSGYAPAGSTAATVRLPPDAATAKCVRFFLTDTDEYDVTYLRSTGEQFIQTDFYPCGTNSAVVMDCDLISTTPLQQRFFGCAGDLYFQFYVSGASYYSWACRNASGNWTASGKKVAADRVKLTLDGFKDSIQVVVGSSTTTKTISANVKSADRFNKASAPLNILASVKGSDKYGRVRLYSFVCQDAGTTVRSFVPRLRKGVAYLYDTVTKKDFCNSAAGEPFYAGAPTAAPTVAEVSDAITGRPSLIVTGLGGAVGEAGSLQILMARQSSKRDIWFCWDDADRGETFSAWAHNERIGSIAANLTGGTFMMPPGAAGAKAGRCFLLPTGGNYDCEYIRAARSQCIDTGILTGTNLAATVDMRLNDTDIFQQRAFGTGTDAFCLYTYINGSGYWAWTAKDSSGNNTSTSVRPTLERTKVTVDCPNDTYKLEIGGKVAKETKISSVVPPASFTKQGTITVALLASKGSTDAFSNMAVAELYGAEVATNGVTARSFSPCATNGVAVMKDAVTGKYFGNAYTNGWTQFIPGGRKGSVTASLVGEPLDLTAAGRGADVFADVHVWLRGAVDNGDGIVGDNEVRDALNRVEVESVVYGTDGHKAVYSNELVRLPGRGVERMMNTIYLPQHIVITNEEAGTGYALPSTLLLKGLADGYGDHWTTVMRVRSDADGRPCSGWQWLMNFGHNGTDKKGVMFGINGSGASRRFGFYAGGSEYKDFRAWHGVTSATMFTNVVAGSWMDIAVSADGQKLSVMILHDWSKAASPNGCMQCGHTYVNPLISLVPNINNVYIGAEGCSNSKRVYPMGANDNYIKCFRGSIQQVAFWRRTLTRQEMLQALCYPRADLWRAGVEDGAAREFADGPKEGGCDADSDMPPLRNGLAAGESTTFTFQLTKDFEDQRNQILRWKSVDTSAAGALRASVNGAALPVEKVAPGQWAQWFVPARDLNAGTNTVTFARADAGAGAVVPDVLTLGGAVQVGRTNNSYGEFALETKPSKDYYAIDGNFRDVRRVLYCAKISDRTNFWCHVNMPEELAGRYRWKFTLDTCTNTSMPKDGMTFRIALNGRTVYDGLAPYNKKDTFSFMLNPEDLPAGENVFNLMCTSPNTDSHFISLDSFSLEPRSPYGMSILVR